MIGGHADEQGHPHLSHLLGGERPDVVVECLLHGRVAFPWVEFAVWWQCPEELPDATLCPYVVPVESMTPDGCDPPVHAGDYLAGCVRPLASDPDSGYGVGVQHRDAESDGGGSVSR